MPAARVISSSLNYASAEVLNSVRLREIQTEWTMEACHTKLRTVYVMAANSGILEHELKGSLTQ